jgi:hypothetical protein
MVPRHSLTKHQSCANTHYMRGARTRFPTGTPLRDAGRRAAGSRTRRAQPPGRGFHFRHKPPPPTGWCERINARVQRTTRAVVAERLAEERHRTRALPAICPTQTAASSCASPPSPTCASTATTNRQTRPRGVRDELRVHPRGQGHADPEVAVGDRRKSMDFTNPPPLYKVKYSRAV